MWETIIDTEFYTSEFYASFYAAHAAALEGMRQSGYTFTQGLANEHYEASGKVYEHGEYVGTWGVRKA